MKKLTAKKSNIKNVVKNEIQKIRDKANIEESYFIGLLWNNPMDGYGQYESRLNGDDFLHDVWGFYYDLGKLMYRDGVSTFDKVTTVSKMKEYNLEIDFENYNGYKTIQDVTTITEEADGNLEYYYNAIDKNRVIVQLIKLFGGKIISNNGNYDHEKMTAKQLLLYWSDKVETIGLDAFTNYETENLYVDAEEFLDEIESESANMLPWYNDWYVNNLTQGVPRGHMTIVGAHSNVGKSSIMVDKFVMSCIANQEKTLIVLNEEDAHSFRQKVLLSILLHEFHTGIQRSRLTNNALSDEDKGKIRQAFQRMNELMDGDESMIKVVYMEQYQIESLEMIVKFWARRGYTNVLIDTHKVSDGYKQRQRWEAFIEDTRALYRLTRPDAGGLNLRTVLTVQLADSHIKDRWLGFDAIGEGKAIKNEASIVLMFRPIFAEEYDTLHVYRKVKDGISGEYVSEDVEISKDKTYYLLFTPKNRFGPNTDNGAEIIVWEVNFNFNSFKPIGWTRSVGRDYD